MRLQPQSWFHVINSFRQFHRAAALYYFLVQFLVFWKYEQHAVFSESYYCYFDIGTFVKALFLT